MKKVLYGVVVLFSCLLLVGCFGTSEETYESNGIKVTMEAGMVEKDLLSATVYLEGTETIFTATKEDFETLAVVDLDEDSTPEEYANAVITNNQGDYEIKTEGDVTYFTYEQEVSGKTYFYLASVYKSDDAFWLVNFACDETNKEKYEPLFLEWAATVEFE